MLSVYVDDFKMAGPKENLAEGRALLRQHIDMEDPVTVTLYLGREQRTDDITMPNGTNVTVMTYDMSSCLGSCVDKYVACSGSRALVQAAVPYLSSDVEEGTLTQAMKNGFHPDDRRLPVDYLQWLKANDLPTGWVHTEDLLAAPEEDVPQGVASNDAEALGELARVQPAC